MRCPKCGFNTFDHLEICSKCQAGFQDERKRLNLPEGPQRPIALMEILKRIEAAAEPVSPPSEPAPKTIPAPMRGPKTFDLDLSQDTELETLADTWKANSETVRVSRPEGLMLDLSLEQ